MPEYKIMSYNIEHMNKMFTSDHKIKESKLEKAKSIAKVIKEVDPDILGICEAANHPDEHKYFIDNFLPDSGYRIAHGVSRGIQDLVIYYRDPFSVVSIDKDIDYYSPWDEDINNDGMKEHLLWDRKPLEVEFKIGSNYPHLLIILVHTKSKGIFSVVDFHEFQKIAQANRARLIGQAQKLRARLETFLDTYDPYPVIVMGDMNDGPGLDPYERTLGKSFVETLMGSVYHPNRIFHNALYWMAEESRETKKELYTAEFPDPIVNHPFGYKHRVWIDHILVSPVMLDPACPVRYVEKSGQIIKKDRISKKASDHFAVWCKIEV